MTIVEFMKKEYGVTNVLKLNGRQTDLLRASIADDVVNDLDYFRNFKQWNRRYKAIEDLMYERYGEY